jgi:hypothetical protein
MSAVAIDAVGLSAIGAGLTWAMSVPGLFSAPNPSLFTIATFEHLPEHVAKWIHAGSLEAFLQASLLAIGGAILYRSWWPFLIVMAMAIWKVISYERALDGGKDGPKLDMLDGIKSTLRAFIKEPAAA